MIEIIELLQQWDTSVLLFLNGLRSDLLDPIMFILTGRFVWLPLYLLLAAIMVRKSGWRKAILSFLIIGATIALADQICGSVIRPLAMRLRPSNPDNPISAYINIVNDYRGGRYGMASCHAANCFALAVYLIRTLKLHRWGIAGMIGWATVVVYTRIYLGVHYPGDIIVGGLIGSAVALGSSTLYKYLAERITYREFFTRWKWIRG